MSHERSNLSEAWRSARARWPGVDLDEARFEAHLEKHASASEPSDLYLAAACLEQVPGALKAFDESCLRPLPRQLASVGVTGAAADDVVQALRVKLLLDTPPRLEAYDGRGPLGAWVRVAAVRLASNLKREAAARDGSRHEPVTPDAPLDPELALLSSSSKALLQTTFDAALAELDREERMALRLSYGHGVNLDGVAQALGVSRATAGRRVLSARERVRELVLSRLGQVVNQPSELESLLALVRSKLELSLGALSSW